MVGVHASFRTSCMRDASTNRHAQPLHAHSRGGTGCPACWAQRRGVIARASGRDACACKKTFGLAAEATALEAIRSTSRKTVVMVGFETDVCVAQSAIELDDFGFRVVAVEDAMYSAGMTEHHRGLQTDAAYRRGSPRPHGDHLRVGPGRRYGVQSHSSVRSKVRPGAGSALTADLAFRDSDKARDA
jgi:hypothetical protein